MFTTVSAPTVSLIVLGGSLVAGGVNDVVLTCSANLDINVVNSGELRFNFSWRGSDNRTLLDGGRISINSSSTSSSSMLILSPLSTTDATITCIVIVTERLTRLIESQPATNSTTINIQSK